MEERTKGTPSPTPLTTDGFNDDPCFSEGHLYRTIGEETEKILDRSIDIADILLQRNVLHIRNLPLCYAYDDVHQMFSKHGEVMSI